LHGFIIDKGDPDAPTEKPGLFKAFGKKTIIPEEGQAIEF